MATAHVTKSPGFDSRSYVLSGRDTPVPSWVPNTDVVVHEGGVTVIVELAGVRREEVNLEVNGGRLRIRGRREKGPRVPNSKYIVMEIPDGDFDFVVDLPVGLESAKATAAYLNGFLRVELPRTSPSDGHSTKIAVADT
ncbi:MAG: Hsp20/alpha crystallin family protein [Limisphaerales bacterium]